MGFLFFPHLVIILSLFFSSSHPWLLFSPGVSTFLILGFYSALGFPLLLTLGFYPSLGLYSAGESICVVTFLFSKPPFFGLIDLGRCQKKCCITTLSYCFRYTMHKNGTLRITSVQEGDEGSYQCLVRNSVDFAQSTGSLLLGGKSTKKPYYSPRRNIFMDCFPMICAEIHAR